MNLEKSKQVYLRTYTGTTSCPCFSHVDLPEQVLPTPIGFCVEIIKEIFPGVLMGKRLLLSVIPNLLLVYLFYTLDSFKLAVGMITGAMIYLIPSFLCYNNYSFSSSISTLTAIRFLKTTNLGKYVILRPLFSNAYKK